MTPPLRVLWAVMKKDLQLELRTRERVVVMFAFVVLVAVLAHYSLPDVILDPSSAQALEAGAGYMWLAVLLAGLLGVGRTFQIEANDGGFEGVLVSPAPLGAVYLGKVAANFVLVWGTALMAMATFRILFDLGSADGWIMLGLTFALASVAFAALATLFAAVTSQTSMGESLLPVLLFPLLVPIVIHGVSATNRIVAGRGFTDVGSHLRMLGAEALLALALGTVLFRFTVED